MNALRKIETLKTKVKTLKDGVEVGGFTSPDRDREVRFEAPKIPIFKGIHDSQEVENIIWY